MVRFDINFVCPHCGSADGILALVNAPQYRQVLGMKISEDDTRAHSELGYEDIGWENNEDLEIEQFECWNCEELIATGELQLFKWLKERDMLKEVT
jgi:hypothetical protein